PAAVGMKLAQPARPVVCVVGDGSALYSPQALWSAVQLGTPVTFIVVNNARYAILESVAAFEGLVGVPSLELTGVDFLAMAAAFFAALPFALGLALMRMSRNLVTRWLPVPFIWVMRGTPILLQLLFWYNVLPLIGIRTSAMATAIIGLALNEVAFMAEIIRGGLLSVKETQRDAAAALGLSRFQILRRIVIPQALRTIAPAMSNEAIIIVKNTSLAS